MKTIYQLTIAVSIITFSTISCKKSFLDTLPLGQLSTEQLKNKDGVNKLLVAAYAMMKGSVQGGVSSHGGVTPMNWLFGDIASDDGASGVTPLDEDRYIVSAQDRDLARKWVWLYESVERSNDVLRLMNEVSALDDVTRKNFTAEARFLRGYFYFELRKIFNKVPWVDETTTNTLQPNDMDIYPNIEADLAFAAENLPATQAEIGRPNTWAAKAFLGKVYMYQNKYDDALTILTDVINNGVTTQGVKYGLMDCYRDAFNVEKENDKESVFAIQMSINDGAVGSNGNPGNNGTYPVIIESGISYGIGPALNASQNLVDAFKTDAQGLPMFDTFADNPLKNDDGILSTDPYSPDITTSVDPRLDWTVSRRGIPYLGWGINPGVEWNGGWGLSGGSLYSVKNMFTKDQLNVYSVPGGPYNSQNYNLIRFSDVLLFAAEAEVEVGGLENARTYVNQVRLRAKNGCYVMSLSDPGQPASNYQVNEYTTAFPDQAYARKAVRFERRLEFGLEGHRHFDLVRWEIADQVINAFMQKEALRPYKTYLASFSFQKGKHEYFPIPEVEIINSSVNGKSVLTQNPGY